MVLEPAAFLDAVMAELGCENDGDLVARMGWRASTTSNISKWRTGKNGISYEPLMEMLEETGWLRIEPAGGGASRPAEGDAVLDQALEEIAAVLEQLVLRVSERAQQPAAAKSRRRRKS